MSQKNDFFPKVDLSKTERIRNSRIFKKVIEAILVPVFVGILLGLGNPITFIVAIFWEVAELVVLFYDREALVIEVILRLLGIID
jgi:malate/lactate dehydrogenase